MEPNRSSRVAQPLWATAACVLALAACGAEPPPGGQVAKPATQPVEQSNRKAPEPAPPAAAKPDGPATAAAPVERPSGDVALAAKVKAALEADPALRVLAVDVTAAAGAVTLFGTADTTANRDQAATVAAGVPGVTSVQNQIVIVRGS